MSTLTTTDALIGADPATVALADRVIAGLFLPADGIEVADRATGAPMGFIAPFGGVKQSGLGHEGSGEGLEEYQSVRFYNIARRETH